MSGRLARWGRLGAVLAALGLIVGPAQPAGATFKYGPIQLSGNIDTHWWARHPEIDDWQFIQNRNTARLRFEWDWLQKGRFIDRYELPFIERSKLFILYRGVYDSFYDIAPGGRQKGVTRFDDIVGGPISGNQPGDVNDDLSLKSGFYSRFSRSNRDEKKYENSLREAYIDLKLKDAPLSFRLGRQQVIWGESDNFRLMDVWNPLDLRWHLQQESWDQIRIPLWLMKGLWDIGRVGSISNAFLELVYNPGDYQPGAKYEWLPNPWAIPINDPLRLGQIQMPSSTNPFLFTPLFDLQGTNFQRGDFHRNPKDASEVGVRFHGVTPQGIEFTTNYLYGRGRGIGQNAGSPLVVDVKEIRSPATTGDPRAFTYQDFQGSFAGQPVLPLLVRAKVRHPYTHIFGLTGNYFDSAYTSAVYRFEMAYQLGTPFLTTDLDKRVAARGYQCVGGPNERRVCASDADCPQGFCQEADVPQEQRAPVGVVKHDTWAGMVGFDRPTWIRWLNRKTTWFLTGQFFWSYIGANTDDLRGGVLTAGARPYFVPESEALPQLTANRGFGQWTTGPYSGLIERTQSADLSAGAVDHSNSDNRRRWELLTTIAGLSFYRGGTIMPFWAVAVDPVNGSVLVQLRVEYFFTNDIVVQLRQNYYGTFGGGMGPRLDPWGAGGLLNQRDETGLRITYQF
jgi:hypothetical protein